MLKRRDVYVELPPELAQPAMCAKLRKSLYGTRDAALNWARIYTEVLESLGFVKGRSSPCAFFHAGRQIRTVVHGDNFVSEGADPDLRWMDAAMKLKFSLKTEIMGGDEGDVKKLKVLNRQLSWSRGAILWEADPRHTEILAEQLGLQGAKPVKTPGEKADGDKQFRFRDIEGDAAD